MDDGDFTFFCAVSWNFIFRFWTFYQNSGSKISALYFVEYYTVFLT